MPRAAIARSTAESGPLIDVAVIGGGIAGAFTAWRLRTTPGARGGGEVPQVALFEASDRIGGRLLSVTPPGMEGIPCELGGMRFLNTHRILAWLVRELELDSTPMPSSNANNLAYLRGSRLRNRELAGHPELPYRLSDAERGMGPGQLLVQHALDQIVPGASEMSIEHLAREIRTSAFDGHPLFEQGFWNVLLRILTNEGYKFARDASGYDCLMSNWNAADAIPFLLADFSPEVSYLKIVQGFDAVPRKLVKLFKAAGGEVRTGWTLRSVNYDSETGVMRLRFRDRLDTVVARRVVLALPRRALELLEPSDILGERTRQGRVLRRRIRSVRPIPLFKLFLCYEYPWWRAVGVHSGRSVTDLPVRQCYYWGVAGSDDGTAWTGKGTLLASYDDEAFTTFWGGLKWDREHPYQPGHVGSHTPTDGSPGPHIPPRAPTSRDWSDYLPPHVMVEEAHRQLAEMHGLRYAPLPYTAAFQDWQVDPYGGGVHFWKSGFRSWEVIPRMLKPLDAVPLYICGEAYSGHQGWAEGALQTAKSMLEQHFGLPAPDLGGASDE